MTTDLAARLKALSAITSPDAPIVSVYLDVRRMDEHQRERARIFLKNALQKARDEHGARLADDLAWIEAQARAAVAGTHEPHAEGLALFACGALGLREALAVRLPFDDAFSVGPRPVLTPLAALVEEVPPAIVVFVDGESARLIPVDARGAGEEVVLEHEVPGRHARGGWAQLALGHYQRHLEAHRGLHFDAIAETLASLTDPRVTRLVLAGEPRMVAAFRRHLPPRLDAIVAGLVGGARHEPAGVLVDRASAALARGDRAQEAAAIGAVVVEAAEQGRAVAGVADTVTAAGRGAIQILYVARGFDRQGRACDACGTLQADDTPACRSCGAATAPVPLGEALVERVVASGGRVEVVDSLPQLTEVGGVVARLRYPLGRTR